MELVVDGRTMAVCGVSGVPVMDIALVFGDRVSLSVLVEHVDMECRPVVAVKKSLGSDDLVMAVTEWNKDSDGRWVADWVVNTEPLQECLGEAESVDLVGELVLVEADGAQHSSRVFGVHVRRDLLGDDVVAPVEVVRDWQGVVAEGVSQAVTNLKSADNTWSGVNTYANDIVLNYNQAIRWVNPDDPEGEIPVRIIGGKPNGSSLPCIYFFGTDEPWVFRANITMGEWFDFRAGWMSATYIDASNGTITSNHLESTSAYIKDLQADSLQVQGAPLRVLNATDDAHALPLGQARELFVTEGAVAEAVSQAVTNVTSTWNTWSGRQDFSGYVGLMDGSHGVLLKGNTRCGSDGDTLSMAYSGAESPYCLDFSWDGAKWRIGGAGTQIMFPYNVLKVGNTIVGEKLVSHGGLLLRSPNESSDGVQVFEVDDNRMAIVGTNVTDEEGNVTAFKGGTRLYLPSADGKPTSATELSEDDRVLTRAEVVALIEQMMSSSSN